MKRIFAGVLTIFLVVIGGCATVFAAENSEAVKENESEKVYYSEAGDNITLRIEEYVEPYLGTDTLINYDNGRAIQCHAFTNYIWQNVFGYDVYSNKCRRTEASTDYEKMGEYINTYARVGDMLRVDGKHSMVITAFDENTVTGYDWLYNKKERKCTYTWEGVKKWGDGTQSYWLYQLEDSVYNLFKDDDYRVDKIFGPQPKNEDTNKNENTDADSDNQEDKNVMTSGKIVLQIDNPVMTANGHYKNIDEFGTTPIIVNGRTVLPIRAIIESMGGTVTWDNDRRIVGLDYKDINMELTIGSEIMKVNGKEIEMDIAPVIINDRTMIPIRYVTEPIGGEVEWFDSIRAVAITY